MSLSRRNFLRLVTSGVAGTLASAELDWDRLLWVPGQKKIFIPDNPTISISQIVAIELERIVPKIQTLFERDDIFYRAIRSKEKTRISSREIRVPLDFQK